MLFRHVDFGILYDRVTRVWPKFPYETLKIIAESSKNPTEGRHITITVSRGQEPLPEHRRFSVSLQDLMSEVCRRGVIPEGTYKVDLAW